MEVIQATKAIRQMRGASQPHLMRCVDGNLYIVKFRNNPQHRRILVNEMLGAQLARLIGLSVPETKFIKVSRELVEGNSSPFLKGGHRWEPCATGLQFGSRYPGDPTQTLVTDILPNKYLRKIRNPDSFLGALVFDKWTCNCERRQMVFYRSLEDEGSGYNALMIDQGACFNSGEWNFPDSPIGCLYPSRVVYESVCDLDSFEPFLSTVEKVEVSALEACAQKIPEEWYVTEKSEVDRLLEQLFLRRRKVRQMILDARNSSARPFPNWSTRDVTPTFQ